MALHLNQRAVDLLLAVVVVCSVLYVYRRPEHRSNDVVGLGLFSDPSLKFVAILFRHGNRSPMFKYITDPHNNAFHGGEMELTKMGKQNMYKKGQILRRLYNGFLSDLYSDSEILIKTTNTSRTFMSAAMVLAGMFPPKGYQKWSDSETVWQPIPIYNDSPDNAMLIVSRGICPAYDSFVRKIFPQIMDFATNENITALFSHLTENCGQPINVTNVYQLYDLFLCQMAEGLQLPEWIKPDHLATMRSIIVKQEYSDIFNSNPRIVKLLLGPLLNEIGLNMEICSNNYTTRKIHLYSGHDVSIAMAISFLSNTFELPDFGASLHFHLYHDKINGFTTKIFYFDRWDNEKGKEVSIPICGNPCKFEDFKTLLTNNNFSEKWEDECLNI